MTTPENKVEAAKPLAAPVNAIAPHSIAKPSIAQPKFHFVDSNNVKQTVAAESKLAIQLPCRATNISDRQLKQLVADVQSKPDCNIMMAPKVTLFTGQQATIADESQRPFVTSVYPVKGELGTAVQPVISVLNEGFNLKLSTTISGDGQVNVNAVLTQSEIGEVEEFTFGEKTDGTSVTVQIPEHKTRSAHVVRSLGEGESLLIDPHFFTKTVTKRRFRSDIIAREFTVAILTPRVIPPQRSDDTQVVRR